MVFPFTPLHCRHSDTFTVLCLCLRHCKNPFGNYVKCIWQEINLLLQNSVSQVSPNPQRRNVTEYKMLLINRSATGQAAKSTSEDTVFWGAEETVLLIRSYSVRLRRYSSLLNKTY